MTYEEKLKLVIKFLDKAILEKRNLIVEFETWGSQMIYIREYAELKNINKIFVCKTQGGLKLEFNITDVGFISFIIPDNELVELKYKANILKEISENKIINHLKLI